MSLCIPQPYRNCPKRDNLSEAFNSNVLSRALMRDAPTYFHQIENSIPVAQLLYTKSIMVLLWHSFNKTKSFLRDASHFSRKGQGTGLRLDKNFIFSLAFSQANFYLSSQSIRL